MQCGAIRGFILSIVITNSLKSLNNTFFPRRYFIRVLCWASQPRTQVKEHPELFPPLICFQSLCNYLYRTLFFPQREIPQDSNFNKSQMPGGQLLRTSLWEKNIVVTAIVTNTSDSQAHLGQVQGEIEGGQKSFLETWKIPCDGIKEHPDNCSGGKTAGPSPG